MRSLPSYSGALDGHASEVPVVILGGGLGTRLAPVLPDRPKLLAPVAGQPILDLQLFRLRQQGFRRVILALGHLADQVCDHIREGIDGMEVITNIEPEPLGTAGAVAHALPLVEGGPIVVMNGDSLVHTDIGAFVAWASANAPGSALIATEIEQADRYGILRLADNGRVESFNEKPKECTRAWINAGTYWLDCEALGMIAAAGRGSLERDILTKLAPGHLTAYRSSDPFIDIGTPESLARAVQWPIDTVKRHGGRGA